MEEILKKIKDEITEPMKELDIVVDSVEWVKENNVNNLMITLDRVNGLDIDAIVEATHIINPIIDELDLIQEEYVLDISSKERGE